MIRWFETLTIRAKLTLGMGALIVLLFSSSIVFFVSAYRSESLVDDLAREGRQMRPPGKSRPSSSTRA
jgi:CHASE3 domain sensor protein